MQDARAVLEKWAAERGEPAYRVRQILPRLWTRPLRVWADATDLPAALRADLDRDFPLAGLTLDTRQVSADGTQKFLWTLAGGDAIESVLIPRKRRTLCIRRKSVVRSVQLLRTGRMVFRRNLGRDITNQVRELVLLIRPALPTMWSSGDGGAAQK